MTMIEAMENTFDKKAIKNFLPIQPGNVRTTYVGGKSESRRAVLTVYTFRGWHHTFCK